MINRLGNSIQINLIPIENKYKRADYIPMRKKFNSNKPYICKSIKDYKIDWLFKEYNILLGFKIQVPYGYIARLYPDKDLYYNYGVEPAVSIVQYYPDDDDDVLAFPVVCTHFKHKDYSLIPDKAPVAQLVIDVEPPKTILNVIDNYEILPYFSED